LDKFRFECFPVFSFLIAFLPEVNGRISTECQVPIPPIEADHHSPYRDRKHQLKNQNREIVIPNISVKARDDHRDEVVKTIKAKVENEQKEVSKVVIPHTVVNPRTMMVHSKDTVIAN
jgi:hypothetical protein